MSAAHNPIKAVGALLLCLVLTVTLLALPEDYLLIILFLKLYQEEVL